MRLIRLLFLGALVFAELSCGDPTDPADDPAAIVFAYAPANDITQIDLYVMSESGRVREPLLRREGVESYPAWSPDGSRVAFAGTPFPAVDLEIYVVRADGSGLTQLTNGLGQHEAPTWSPDGSRIAFVQTGVSSAALAIMNSDGSGLTPIPGTDGAHTHQPPSWSPDGLRLAFARRIGSRYAIWVVGPDGSGLMQLTSGTCGDFYPAWSPDGTKLAFVSCETTGNDGGIHVVDANGSNKRQLTNDRTDGSLSWSPDGGRIVFERRGSGIDLYVVNVHDGQVLNLTATPSPELEMEPNWRRAP